MNRRLTALGRPLGWVASLVVLGLLPLGAARGQDIVRVEEDWELVVGDPDVNSCGPQVVTTMSPGWDISGTYFTMEINHRSAPYWQPGGISIHRWNGEWRMASFDRSDRTIMNTDGEVVSWTQALYFEDGKLTYKIYNGTSTTWGPFGYSGWVKLQCAWDDDHLNYYTPAVSVAESGAAYAGNRIHTLKIKQIRLTLENGQTLTDNTERIVQELIE